MTMTPYILQTDNICIMPEICVCECKGMAPYSGTVDLNWVGKNEPISAKKVRKFKCIATLGICLETIKFSWEPMPTSPSCRHCMTYLVI